MRLGADGRPITAAEEKRRYTDALRYLRDLRAHQPAGRPAAPVMDIFVGGLPQFGDRAAWTQWIPGAADLPRAELNQRQADVAQVVFGEVVRWVGKCAGPHSPIALADIHLDEAAPHLQLLFVAADERGRLGWNKVAAGFVGANPPGLNDRLFMSAVQDHFHEDVASHFGLERGAKGSMTTAHEDVDRTMGAAARLREEEQEAARALQALAEREAEISGERDEWRAAASGEHDHPEPVGDYGIPLNPGRMSQLVMDGRQHGWPADLSRKVDDLRARRAAALAERDEWRAAASGEHDHPEPVGDFSVPLKPGRMSQLVMDGRQHGWPADLSGKVDRLAAVLRTEREAANELTAERDRALRLREVDAESHRKRADLLKRLGQYLAEQKRHIKTLTIENDKIRAWRPGPLIRSLEAAAAQHADELVTTKREGRAAGRQEAAKELTAERDQRTAAQVALRTATAEAKRATATIETLQDQVAHDGDELTALRTQVADADKALATLQAENKRLWTANLAAAPDVPARPDPVVIEPSGSDLNRRR